MNLGMRENRLLSKQNSRIERFFILEKIIRMYIKDTYKVESGEEMLERNDEIAGN